MPTPEVAPSPVRASVKVNVPFWLLLPPGTVDTLIWSPSFSPEYSSEKPALNVCVRQTLVRLSDAVQMGPEECDG